MQPLNPIIIEYQDAELLVFPYECKKFSLRIDGMKGSCPVCRGTIDDLRGKINEFSACIEINAYGHCRDCNLVVKLDTVRYYKGGRITFNHQTLGWIEGVKQFTFRSRIRLFLRGLKEWIFGK